MSVDNVELVRRGFDVVTRAFDAYWREQRSIAAALEADDLWPEWRELFDLFDQDVEWKTLFLGTTFRGHMGVARGFDDFLTWAEDYRPSLEDVADLGGNQVLADVAFTGKPKGGPRMDARFYAVLTLEDGQVASLHEYTTREEALAEAAAQQS